MLKFHPFGLGSSTGETSAEVLGGKGAGLAWMDSEGFPVPPGFTIDTTVWVAYDKAPKGTLKEILKTLPSYCSMLVEKFGYMPLLSVRSGARVSCPGMMDTILNVGIDASNADFWRHKLGSQCFENSLHRLVVMYGSVVKGLPRLALEQGDSVDALKYYRRSTGEDFPNAAGQLIGAVEAVFKSWDNERADIYRKQHSIPRTWGTAVNVQAMVFGNLNNQSATGVLFTRNPDTGEAFVKGEFLVNAQGEDVVAGIRTPQPLSEMEQWEPSGKELKQQLYTLVLKLENLRKEVQDVEFTIQDGQLYLLQTRNAKRSARAAVRIAVEMAKEGLLSKQEAVQRVSPKQFDMAQMPVIASGFKKVPAYKGLPACSGVVTGKPVFSSADAIACKQPCILITQETTPDDIGGMLASKGVITMTGGLTSHAAVVARGENVPCITGVGVSLEAFHGVEKISMDGSTGSIWLQEVPIESSQNGFLTEFKNLLYEVLGAIQMIDSEPAVLMDQAALVLGTQMLQPFQAASLIARTALKVKKLYVDLTITEGPEQRFFSICETWGPDMLTLMELKKFVKGCQDAGNTSWANTIKERVVLVGVLTEDFRFIAAANDLRSLVMAEQEILTGGSLDYNDPAVKKVMAWKGQEGLSFVTLGGYVAGMKSMVPVETALQIVGA